MRTRIRKCLLGGGTSALLLLTSAVVSAAEPGWYIGLSAGQSSAEIDKDELDDLVTFAFAAAGAPVLSGTSTLDDSDTAWSVFAGYQVSKYFAVEAGYVNLGTFPYNSSGTVNPPGPVTSTPASFNIDFESTGFTVAAIGAIPVSEAFDIHGRVGVLFSDTQIMLNGSATGVSASDEISANAQDFFYGIGAAITFAERWSLSLDWQQYKDVGDEEETGEADLDLISLSVLLRL